MYFRMLRRAAVLRKGQAAAALAAVIVAAAASTAMLNLYVDVQAKLRKEFRKFGANIVVQAKSSEPSVEASAPQALQQIFAAVGNRGLVVPFAYTVVRTEKDQPVVVAATDFEKVRQLNPWWSVSAWPSSDRQALVGVRASPAINRGDMKPFSLNFQGRELRLTPAGTVHTGAGEDSRVYISLDDYRSWTGLEPTVIEIAAAGTAEQVSTLMSDLQRALPQADVRAVRQVTEGEANVLGKTRSTLLWSAAFIVIIAGLCVLATLMGWVFDRRRDFAIMKALGASDRLIAAFVSGEAALLGLAGAIIGYALGVLIAEIIGRVNFHAPVAPRLGLLPPVLAGALLLTLISTLLPLRLLRAIQPAMILRGE
jgi:putative ABC transport system permease protein